MGSHRPWRDDRPKLTLNPVEGTIIALDLDRFDEFVGERGLSRYSPNIVTGTLTHLVEELVRKWQGVVVFGLDWERGTEEAVIEIPYVRPEELKEDLERILREIRRLGASITIVAVHDYVLGRPAKERREAYYGTPGRARAWRELRRLKRKGGGVLKIIG